MEYYSAIKSDEFMKFLGIWLELENIILSEVTKSRRMKTTVWILRSFLEGRSKYPWEEIWRQSLEHNEKERLSSDCPMEIYPIYSSQIPATYVSEDGLVGHQ